MDVDGACDRIYNISNLLKYQAEDFLCLHWEMILCVVMIFTLSGTILGIATQ